MMWKKDNEPAQPEPHPAPAAPVVRPAPAPAEPRQQAASIGPSISIKGELTGGEDLVIHGQVEGKVDLRQNNITVGKTGRVKADMYGRTICVEGDVEGNLYGGEQIVLRQSGGVRGNIIAPRVSLEDGSKFKGAIDMEPRPGERPAGGPEVRPRGDAGARPPEVRPAAPRVEATASKP
jgi:cytoskeletal protein CcmA (bactofilin family)